MREDTGMPVSIGNVQYLIHLHIMMAISNLISVLILRILYTVVLLLQCVDLLG